MKVLEIELKEETKEALLNIRPKGFLYIDYIKLKNFYNDTVIKEKSFEIKMKEKFLRKQKANHYLKILFYGVKMLLNCKRWKKSVLYQESTINQTKFYGSGNSLDFIQQVNLTKICKIIFKK